MLADHNPYPEFAMVSLEKSNQLTYSSDIYSFCVVNLGFFWQMPSLQIYDGWDQFSKKGQSRPFENKTRIDLDPKGTNLTITNRIGFVYLQMNKNF
jgi:hypothetical protein